MTAQRWKLTAFVLFLALASLLAYSSLQGKIGQNFTPDAVVLQAQKLNQLVTVRYRIERVVAMTEEKQPMGEESILLMVEGDVLAGVDLQKVSVADLTTDASGAQTITLPDAAILNASLDETKTKVWDRHVTWWTPWVAPDPDLEHKARLKALAEVRKAAIDMGILGQARTNAQTSLQNLFGAMGWKVSVKVRGLD